MDQYEQLKKAAPVVTTTETVNKSETVIFEKDRQLEELRVLLKDALSASANANNNNNMASYNSNRELLEKLDNLQEENRELRTSLRGLSEQQQALSSEDPKKSQIIVDTMNQLF